LVGGPRGRIIEIYGPEAGGKTSIALQILGQAQKQGGVGAFVDLEYALDPMLASNCYGVDIDNLLYGTPTTGE
jgi:recombination protein RecA